jgi:hypothetical protein
MPSRRSSASISPRFVQAAASRMMRSFSAAVNDRLLPGFGTTSTEAPLAWAGASCAAGAGLALLREICPFALGRAMGGHEL